MAKQLPMKAGSTKDFSAGPNIRDASSEIGDNEVIDAWNITFDERGGASSRLGYVKRNGSPYGSVVTVNVFYSGVLATTVTQTGRNLYQGTSTTITGTFSTADRVVFADFNGKCFAGHPVDGLFYWDGAIWLHVADADTPATVVALAVWQNKLWLVPAASDTVYWSAAGDGTAWDVDDFNGIREKDNEPLVGLHISSGQDIIGRPGLLAFKQESTYRINDSTTGAYDTVDATIGAANHVAIVGVGAKVFALSRSGIFYFQEGLPGMNEVSERFAPLWNTAHINTTRTDLYCAGRKHGHARFSLPRSGSTANDLAIEFHPDQGWIAPGSNAMSCYASSPADVLYGGSPTVVGQVYELDTGGTDDGADIEWRVQTRWFELNDGFLASVWQLRLHGRGEGTVTVQRDYQIDGGDDFAFDLSGDLIVYDNGLLYDSGLEYAIPVYQTTAPLYSIGVCRQLGMIFSGSSNTTAMGPQILGAGAEPELGAFGLYGVEWLFVPLGLS